MQSFTNLTRILLSKTVSALQSAVNFTQCGFANNTEIPKKPDSFTPVLRFAVCSDIHLKAKEDEPEEERLAAMLDFLYQYAAGQNYNKFDALVVAGDMTDEGKPEQYRQFNRIVNNHLKDETELLICAGNHEYIAYRDKDASEGNRVFTKEMNRPVNSHHTINGYHFITASYADDGKTFRSRTAWLKQELDNAAADCAQKPIFVIQHPAPFATIYGSINWGDMSTPKVLKHYHQVIDFSGHSHYPINDPRSIYQGKYTALGCGTLSYYETELDYIAGQFPYNSQSAAQFNLVECDAEGNVFVRTYDLITNQFFKTEYYFTGLADKKFDYTFNKNKKRNKAPRFDDKSVYIGKNEKGETELTFSGTNEETVTESYKITVRNNGKVVFKYNVCGKYMYLFEKNEYRFCLGKLKSGEKYKVHITALNAYGKCSKPFIHTFTAK